MQEAGPMNDGNTRYLGLDVHKATIAVAVADAGSQPTLYGTIANDPSAVRKLVGQLGRATKLSVAYEAGPTGYALHRQLVGLGVECQVVAPALIPKRAGDRVKTDGRDAITLARLLRSGDLTPVGVPGEEDEALRDLVRARYDAKADVLRAKHRLGKFLLRRGVQAPHEVKAWTVRYQAWLNQLTFPQAAAGNGSRGRREDSTPREGSAKVRRGQPSDRNHLGTSGSARNRTPLRGHHRGRDRSPPAFPQRSRLYELHRVDEQ